MRILIILIIASILSACSSARTAGTNANGDRRLEYREPEKLDQSPEQVAENAKHEKWKQEREAYLKNLNEAEKKRQDAIRKCEAERIKKPANANTNASEDTDDGPVEKPLTCEELHPPAFEKNLGQ